MVRISGGLVPSLAQELAGTVLADRTASLVALRRPGGELIDRCLAIAFAGNRSFTGEPVLELHLHGGRAVVAALFEILSAHSGLRMAEPGEFTRRAFLNGKLDLIEAEAIADLVEAETESQRRLAIAGGSGAQSALYESWRAALIEARAMLEADLDFADEADIPGSVADFAIAHAEQLRTEIANHLALAHHGEILREGFRIALIGMPNVGKSSLLNLLARRDVALVSPEPGTTRDLVEVSLDLAGFKVIVTDTAGLRDTENTVERMGMDRTHKTARSADLILALDDGSGLPTISVEDEAKLVKVNTKADLRTAPPGLSVSSITGHGVDALIEKVAELIKAATAGPSQGSVVPTRIRHRLALEASLKHLDKGLDASLAPEICAEEFRLAADRLGELTGAVRPDDVLDLVFSRFCIGK